MVERSGEGNDGDGRGINAPVLAAETQSIVDEEAQKPESLKKIEKEIEAE